ncbi:M1 family metallopeptidase [Pontibacter sp. G13]|uniref:M1 family metallopeptidase n=1 Tax=Pontibacter sp. G13 TaxID=3074898 RepID=UPI00288B9468|nr:M1 family metallopeptidase [Pontibacter sp. G13]WNJ19409.1 M1 family metallopeptidase [Pontibacter sp. G13]
MLVLGGQGLSAQPLIWQQKASYQMEVELDPGTHHVTGQQSVTYVNNSPDTLDKVYYHLYFNAFQPGSMMDVRSRTIEDPDPRVGDRISKLSPDEIGYQKILSLTQDGVVLTPEIKGTILKVMLDKPLLPGDSTVFDMAFESQVPVQIRRSGRDNREGVDYSMTQWYPKLAEYDTEGWHPTPYVGREFYGVWSDFDVKITLPAEYLIGGTGYLQNPNEIGHGYEEDGVAVAHEAGAKLTWHFIAPMVHDFAWAADPEFTHDKLQVPDGPMLHFIYFPGKNYSETWKQYQPLVVETFQIMKNVVGAYPYLQYTVIQGGDGGMEYPMATLIRGNRSIGSLLGVTVHEGIHSWFQHLLGTNESKYAWMDEGFTSFYEDYVMNQFVTEPMFNPYANNALSYLNFIKTGKEEPSIRHSDHFHTNAAYGRSAYTKGALFLVGIQYIVGKEAFERGMKRYYTTWRYHHPTPHDFLLCMEIESGIELDWFLEYWIGTVDVIDFSIESVDATPDKSGTQIQLSRVGNIPMPLDVLVEYTDGHRELHYIPIRMMFGQKGKDMYDIPIIEHPDWRWTESEYLIELDVPKDQIKQITLDPSYRLTDVERKDNYYPKFKGYKSYGAEAAESVQ